MKDPDAENGRKERSNLADFFKMMKRGLSKCLDPTLACPNSAIRAHSVQNATALSFIEESNHVCELKMRILNGSPVCAFEKVGRNNASTFTGLCSKHDTEIFLPIDTKPLDINNKEQLFLIAYRSVTRELHVVMEGAARIQGAYQTLVATGKIPSDRMTPQGLEATQHLLKAWGVWKYRYRYFDKDLANRQFDNIKHSIFKIENEKPILAASSFFSVEDKPWGQSFPAAILNVIPTADLETVVIFSYADEHSGKVRKYISSIILAKDREKKYELSYMLLNRAENFFMSPAAVQSWPEDKKRFIEASFFSTAQQVAEINRDPRLMLFE